MKSWKTTLGGILIAVGQFAPQMLPPEYTWVGATLTGIGGILLGGAARDNSVSSKAAGVQ